MTSKYVSDNCSNEGFGMQKFENNLLRVSTKSIEIFAQSSKVFTQTSNLLEHATKKLVQSTDVMP